MGGNCSYDDLIALGPSTVDNQTLKKEKWDEVCKAAGKTPDEYKNVDMFWMVPWVEAVFLALYDTETTYFHCIVACEPDGVKLADCVPDQIGYGQASELKIFYELYNHKKFKQLCYKCSTFYFHVVDPTTGEYKHFYSNASSGTLKDALQAIKQKRDSIAVLRSLCG